MNTTAFFTVFICGFLLTIPGWWVVGNKLSTENTDRYSETGVSARTAGFWGMLTLSALVVVVAVAAGAIGVN